MVEIGLSDFDKITVNILKTYFKQIPPKVVSYRDYKHCSQFYFRSEQQQSPGGTSICWGYRDVPPVMGSLRV